MTKRTKLIFDELIQQVAAVRDGDWEASYVNDEDDDSLAKLESVLTDALSDIAYERSQIANAH